VRYNQNYKEMDQKILLVEDEKPLQKKITNILMTFGFDQLKVASNYEEGKSFYNIYQPNLAILDVNLGGAKKSGIDLALELNLKEKIPFLFISSYFDMDTYERIKRLQPNQFLKKGFSDLELLQAVELSLLSLNDNEDTSQDKEEVNNLSPHTARSLPDKLTDFIFVRKGQLHTKVKFNEIVSIESGGKYSLIYTLKKRYISSKSISTISAILPATFLRIHRRWIINMEFITAIDTSSYEMLLGDNAYPIGRSYRKKVMSIFPSI